MWRGVDCTSGSPGQQWAGGGAQRAAAHVTQRVAVGRASRRASGIVAPQRSHTPNVPVSTRASAASIAASRPRPSSASDETCARATATVEPSGSCSSSMFASRADSTMSAQLSSNPRRRATVSRRFSTSSARAASGVMPPSYGHRRPTRHGTGTSDSGPSCTAVRRVGTGTPQDDRRVTRPVEVPRRSATPGVTAAACAATAPRTRRPPRGETPGPPRVAGRWRRCQRVLTRFAPETTDVDELAARIRRVLVDLSQHPRHLGLRVRSTRFETRDETRSTAMRFVRFVGMVRRRLSSKN